MNESDKQSQVTPRIVCVGSNQESENVLRGLIAANAHLVGLVTLPPAQSTGISDYVDLHPLCEQHGIETVDTTNINSETTLSEIQALEADYIYTLGWSQIFGEDLLNIPRKYVVGSHPSPRPIGRGRAPVPWTILQGNSESAVTLFRMDAGVDSGPILCQKWFEVSRDAYAEDVYGQVTNNLREGFVELYEAHASGQPIMEIEQAAKIATHRGKRTPADGHIDFRQPVAQIAKLIRAVSRPYPGAYLYYQGQRLTVWKCNLDNIPAYIGTTGQILLRQHQSLLVQAGDLPMWISEIEGDDGPIDTRQFRVGQKFGFAVEDEIFQMRLEIERLREELRQLKSADVDTTWRKSA